MKRVYIIPCMLGFVSLLLWFFSVTEARGNISKGLSSLGLVSIMPPGFLISLVVLSISFLITLRIKNIRWHALFLQFSLLIVFVHLTPFLVEGTPRFTQTYVNYNSVDYILQQTRLNPSTQWIHNWPGLSILWGIVVQVTAIPVEPFLGMYPMLYNVFLLFPLFAFFRLVFNDNKQSWTATWIFYIANWIGQDYFSMQSLGFFAFVLFSLLIFKFGDSSAHFRNWIILTPLVFLFATTTHLLSSIAILSLVLAFFVFKQFRKLPIVVLLISIFAFWTTSGATIYLQWNAKTLIEQAFDFWPKLQTNIVARVAGSSGRVIAVQVRLVFSALITLFGIMGVLLLYTYKKIGSLEKKIFLMLFSVFLLLFFSSYGGELFMRLYLFSLVPLCYFIVKGFRWKIMYYTFLVLIVILPVVHIIARYGNESFDYVPSSEIIGGEFFHQNTIEGFVIGGYRDYKYRSSYEYFSFTDTEWKNNALSLGWIEDQRLNWPSFVCISYGIREYYNFFLGEPQFIVETAKNLTESTRYNKIYSNPNFEVYLELRQ